MIALLSILICIATLVVPLFYLNVTIDPCHIPRFLLLAVILFLSAAILFIRLLKQRDGFDFSILLRSIFPLFLIYLVVCGISLFNAINLSEGIFEILKSILPFVLMLISALIFYHSPTTRLQVVKSITICAMILSILGICQYHNIAFQWIPGNGYPYSTMANKNLLASILAFSLPFILYALLRFRGFWRITSNLSIILASYAILVSKTRAVWLALALAALVTFISFILAYGKIRKWWPNRWSYFRRILVVVILMCAVSLPIVLSDSGYFKKAVSIGDCEHASAHERLMLWAKSVEMFLEKPLFGIGAGNWKINIPACGTEGLRSELGEIHFQRPHNDYMWVLTESGIIGFLAYLAIFVVIINYCTRIITASRSEENGLYAATMLFGIVVIMIVSFFSYPKERISHLMLTSLLFGSVLSVYHQTFPIQKTVKRLSQLIITAGVLLLLVACIVIGCFRINGEIHTRKALIARTNNNNWKVIEEVNKALSPWYTLDPMATPITWYRGVAYFSLENRELACADFVAAFQAHPYHVHILNNLASCYEWYDDHEHAAEYYLRALAIAPRFEEAMINLAAVYYNMGRYREALLVLLSVENSRHNQRFMLYYEAITKKLQEEWLI